MDHPNLIVSIFIDMSMVQKGSMKSLSSLLIFLLLQSKKVGKDQESIQLCTIPDPGCHMEK